MATSKLCFGPYNDPGGPTGKRHYDLPHDANCRNPAFLVRISPQTYTATVAVRNVSNEPSPNDITVSFYSIGLPPVVTTGRIDAFAQKMLSGVATNMIIGQSTFSINPDNIAPFSSASDRPWIVGPVTLAPKPRGIILVATLVCPSWNLFPTPGTEPSLDPCVAVWVGP